MTTAEYQFRTPTKKCYHCERKKSLHRKKFIIECCAMLVQRLRGKIDAWIALQGNRTGSITFHLQQYFKVLVGRKWKLEMNIYESARRENNCKAKILQEESSPRTAKRKNTSTREIGIRASGSIPAPIRCVRNFSVLNGKWPKNLDYGGFCIRIWTNNLPISRNLLAFSGLRNLT